MVTLVEELRAAWLAGVSMEAVLSRVVIETSSRASGCWRLESGTLRLVGFGWASDMPDDVSQGFQATTRLVPLDQTGLGIVKAAVTGQPAIGRRDPQASGLDGSASWIAKFGAHSSLAVPIRNVETNSILGVLAVSTAAAVEENDSLWQLMIRLSNELGK